jgi:hypothetical protein
LVVLAVKGSIVIAVPHLFGDLECFLQPLEALLERRERDSEPLVLAVVPGRTYAEPGAPAGEDVQCGHLLDEYAGMPVGDTGDQRTKTDSLRLTSQVAEARVHLQHVGLGGRPVMGIWK